MNTPYPVIKINRNDDVVVTRFPLAKQTFLPNENITINMDIPAGHKIAVHDIHRGEAVKKYGQIIGFATEEIKQGDHIHTHNLGMGDFTRDYAFCKDTTTLEKAEKTDNFMGIRRPDGRIATRNFIGILTSVNCSATVARAIEDHYKNVGLDNFPQVDGVVALPQSFGCAFGSNSETMVTMRRTLSGYARHVNFAGVLIVGLGCESNQIKDLIRTEGLKEGAFLHSITIQEEGGTQKTINKGIEIIDAMLLEANKVVREPCPVSEIILALECGGSDSYSGISANPVLGYVTDKIVRQGGTAVLSETSEIYGAEHLLTRRAVTPDVGKKLITRIKWWEDYCTRTKSEMNNNPSAGNKAGGLTTVLEKSLGGIAKGGSSNLVEVYEYAEPIIAKGLVFMDTPGYDPMAVTGQIAGGANLLCFTTGRGSAFGSKPTPSLKIATNNALWLRQREDMDMNCGDVADGTETIAQAGERLYALVLAVASGQKTSSEKFGYGGLEFVPWTMNAIM